MKVLIVAHEKAWAEAIGTAFTRDHDVTKTESLDRATEQLSNEPHAVVLVDLSAQGVERVLNKLAASTMAPSRRPIVIVITVPGRPTQRILDLFGSSLVSDVIALSMGDFGWPEFGQFLLQKTECFHQIREADRASAELETRAHAEMECKSAKMRELDAQIRNAAAADSRVLIMGETGTGKELVARSIHRHSPRCGRPFVAINSAAVPSGLIESELFGNVKGAFTGAVERMGKFELASGGTLFLDEIGEMSHELQAKLLRVLSDGVVVRVGGSKEIRVDVRLLSATNRDLWDMVQKREFREDLFWRIAVIPIKVPPLRDRGEDVDALAEHFLEKYSRKNGREPTPAFDQEAQHALRQYRWRGNVRELENVMERITVMHRPHMVTVTDLTAFLQSSAAVVVQQQREWSIADFMEEFRRLLSAENAGDVQELTEFLEIRPKGNRKPATETVLNVLLQLVHAPNTRLKKADLLTSDIKSTTTITGCGWVLGARLAWVIVRASEERIERDECERLMNAGTREDTKDIRKITYCAELNGAATIGDAEPMSGVE